jgi:transcriptional regulator EpsA
MEHPTPSLFSERDQKNLIRAIEASLGPLNSIEDFRRFIREQIRPLINHGMLVAGVGRLTFDVLRIQHVIGVDCPAGFLEQIKRKVPLSERPVTSQWLANRKPILIDPVLNAAMLSEAGKREIEQFNLGNLAIHGHLDISGRMASYFSFARVSPPLTEHLALLLEVLAPHIHTALMKVIPLSSDAAASSLSQKELEILRWMVDGKTNREIATILSKSELTVRNQLHKLFGKLGAANRAEAIGRADELGLLAHPKGQ